MFKNYFNTAWRNLVRNKAYSGLNIAGLATGMAVALLIGLWAWYQFSYDRFLPGYDRIYQAKYRSVKNGQTEVQTATSLMLEGVLKKDIPGLQYVVQMDWTSTHGLVVGDNKLYNRGAMAGPDFFRMFQFPLVHGNAADVLRDPYSIVLSESTATALFGKEDPMNKMVRIDNRHDLKVTGVMKDIPANSTLQFTYMIPFSYKVISEDWVKRASTTWNNNSFQTFVMLQPGVTYAQVQPNLQALLKRHKPDWYKLIKAEVFIHPMRDWHLLSDFRNGVAVGGFIDYVKMFGLIGAMVLLIACINFINLSTARSEKRAREVGIRKTVGSRRRQLVLQFMIESLVVTVLSFALAVLLVQLILPSFNQLAGTDVHIPFYNGWFWAMMLAYILVTGLLAGSRPAFYFSSFQPVKVLKGTLTVTKAAAWPRKMLVVLQFSCSIALIISTVIVYQQIQHAKDRPLGYNNDRLLMSDMSTDLKKSYPALRNDLLKSGLVSSVTAASSPATGIWSWNGVDDWQGKLPDEVLGIATIVVTDDYFSTMGMKLKEGRDFSNDPGKDSLSVILNEAAVKRFRYKEALNQVITWNNKESRIKVIGVVKDALMLSPFSPPEPTLFVYDRAELNVMMYRLAPNVRTSDALAKLRGIFTQYNPSFPYNYEFTDESYRNKFILEALIGKLAAIFAGLAIFISCLGLFGLAAYMAEQRKKEIGVRKVLGATVSQLWLLLSKDFITLVLVSCVIASPIAFYFLHRWLQEYEYRVPIGPWVFFASGGMAMVITVITISWQAIRAAVSNPVKSLRSE